MTFLEEKLERLKAYRKDRLEISHWIIRHPQEFKNLLIYAQKTDEDISYKAAWIIEMACIENLSLLYPYLDEFLLLLPKVHKDQAVRPLAKVCELLTEAYYGKTPHPVQKITTLKHREQLTEICFDWLISKQKVAAKAYAMQCLYFLGKDFDWIYPELRINIEKEFPAQLPAFKARAKNVLRLLDKNL